MVFDGFKWVTKVPDENGENSGVISTALTAEFAMLAGQIVETLMLNGETIRLDGDIQMAGRRSQGKLLRFKAAPIAYRVGQGG